MSGFSFFPYFHKLKNAMSNSLAALEHELGYKFQDTALLERALTHRSWAYEKLPLGDEEQIRNLQNESLEFLGDSVVGLAVAEYLLANHPKATEGELTLMKHRLVSTEMLAKNAEKLGLGEFLKVGRGEEKTGGRKKQALLADVFEAVIAAVFLDTGYISARAFINRIMRDELRDVSPEKSIDYKTMLQETLQSSKRQAPVYNLVKTEGPPHQRTFFVEAVWDGGSAGGFGNSIKSAEMAAADLALKQLNNEHSIKKSK